jgi:hypothetical protein
VFFPSAEEVLNGGKRNRYRLVSKIAGIEQLSIEWELGSGDDGYIA